MISGSRYLLILAVGSLSLWSGGAWTSHLLSRTSSPLVRFHITQSALATRSTSRRSVPVVRRSPHPIFHSVTMVTANAGWGLSASHQVLHTTDGQKTWTVVSPAHPRVTPLTLTAITTSRAMFIATPRNLNRSAIVWTTDDAGQHWQTQRLQGADTATIAKVSWESSRQGWILVTLEFDGEKPPPGYRPPDDRGFETVLYQTTDSGRLWHLVPSQTLPYEANVVTFTSVETGWLLAMTGGPGEPVLYRTSDGGADWSPVALSVPPAVAGSQAEAEPFSRPVFATATIGAILTWYYPDGHEQPVVYVTQNGGRVWQWIVLPPIVSARVQPVSLHWKKTAMNWTLSIDNPSRQVIAQWQIPR